MAGRSMFKPDNYHLHNYIHQHFKAKLRSRVAANSFTGLIIALASTGVAFFGLHWNYLEATSGEWGWVFIAQVLIYLLSVLILKMNFLENIIWEISSKS